MGEKNNYFIVKKKALPEVLLKVVEAKRLLEADKNMTKQELSPKGGAVKKALNLLSKVRKISLQMQEYKQMPFMIQCQVIRT